MRNSDSRREATCRCVATGASARDPSVRRFGLALLVGLSACGVRSRTPPPPPSSEVPPPPPAQAARTEPADAAVDDAVSGTLYVPAYSNLTTAEPGRIRLGITLSIRNVDPRRSVTLRYVDYYDTPGHRMRRYLEHPKRIGPLGTEEFVVAVRDEFGGPGANFLVGWAAGADTHAPLAETVMIGHAGAGYVSFTSRGVAVETDGPEEGRDARGE